MDPRTPLPTNRPRHRRNTRRRPQRWPLARTRRGCRARLARHLGLPLAATLCLLAVALVLLPAVTR